VLEAEARAEAEAGLPPRGRGKAPILTLDQLKQVLAACPDGLDGYRDRALLLMGVGIAARPGELAGLLARNVTVHPRGLTVATLYGKRGGRTVNVLTGDYPETDPRQAWLDWVDAVGLSPDGPAFLRVDQWGNVGGALGNHGVYEVIVRAGERADIAGLKGHTLRPTMATLARQAGKPTEEIADQGGWARDSRALHGYIRIVDDWVNNATRGMGL
jgi:integrase